MLIYLKFNQLIVDETSPDGSFPVTVVTSHASQSVREAFVNVVSKYGAFNTRKAYPTKKWGDTRVRNKRTNVEVEVPDFSQLVMLVFDKPVPIDEVVALLTSVREVDYAHGPLEAVLAVAPNDWLYANGPQWELGKINAETAWNYAKGQGFKIAINDEWVSGVSVHPDLSGRLVNDFGYYGGHGTWVASVAGAKTNNTDNMASLGWNVSLEGYIMGSTTIGQAVNDGADIINCSWVTTTDYPSIREAVYAALASGVVVVAAAGNAEYCTQCVKYPAAYNTMIGGTRHQVIAVSATVQNDYFRTGWTYSPGTDPIGNPTTAFIDVAAPGDQTVETTDGVWVAYSDATQHVLVKREGTSFATPMVSALSALLLEVEPTLTPPQVYDVITQTADKVGQYSYVNGWNRYLGYGRINAGEAVCGLAGPCLDPPTNLIVTNSGSIGQFPNLVWTASASGLTASYRVYRQNPGSSTWNLIKTTTSTSHTDNGVVIAPKSGTNDYHYRVHTVAKYSGSESPPSNEVSIWGQPSSKTDASSTHGVSADDAVPLTFSLEQNYPNPFNPTTQIRFAIPEAVETSLVVYDALGHEVRRIVDGMMAMGYHVVNFDATGLATGVYTYRLAAGEFVRTRQMIVVK